MAEGFSSVPGVGGRAFKIALSVEKEGAAHSTLRLRSFLRQFDGQFPPEYYDFINEGQPEPEWSSIYPVEWQAACDEALQLELGSDDASEKLNARLDEIRETSRQGVILIGGPPCQAYSLVGRARNRGKQGYEAKDDNRHFLYEEYIRILDRLQPVAFVMENVKGMLSSSVDGQSRIFDQVLRDLKGERPSATAYRLIALDPRSQRSFETGAAEPQGSDFVVRAEDFGIPQARHRVIVVGLRADLADGIPDTALADLMVRHSLKADVSHVLDGMPLLRSGLSKGDSIDAWGTAVDGAMALVARLENCLPETHRETFSAKVTLSQKKFAKLKSKLSREGSGTGIAADCIPDLKKWIYDPRIRLLPNHSARGHMESDLGRYFFAAIFAEVMGRSPKASDYPDELAPAHANWSTGKFADRFRVQLRSAPSTTITSHIAKDGHYFIHPDPVQCRSLTVREAARLQTFPDNYYFKGNRTEQYTQVGNAVPPLLAHWIGEALCSILNSVRPKQRA